MPNNVNYAERWEPELLEIFMQESLISPFITNNVRFMEDGKTFHFTQMSTTGFKSHSRNGGWNRGSFTQTDVPFTLKHDRDISFLVDKADVSESNATASIQNIAKVFTRTQSTPEKNALFFSKCAALANGRDCDSKLRLTFPDGAIFTAPVVLQVKDFMGGDATNVAPLTFDCVSNGKPTFEPKKA